MLSIRVKNVPEKNDQVIFYVHKFGVEDHSNVDKFLGRQLTGEERKVQGIHKTEVM